jgi:hypothetical protein
MAVPVPRAVDPPRAKTLSSGKLNFAHSDWAGYSVFEEAFTLGHHAA